MRLILSLPVAGFFTEMENMGQMVHPKFHMFVFKYRYLTQDHFVKDFTFLISPKY